MTTNEAAEVEAPKEIPEWARGEKLRKIEKNVVIQNIMKKKAKLSCKEAVIGKTFCSYFSVMKLVCKLIYDGPPNLNLWSY